MTWSKTYSGTSEEVGTQFAADVETIQAGLPEFERTDVEHARDASVLVLRAVPSDTARVSLLVSGHGWRDAATGKGGGAMTVTINYVLTPRDDAGQSL